MKYVLDTSIINKLVDGKIKHVDLPNDGEFVVAHTQIDELNNTNNRERRASLFLKLAQLRPRLVPSKSILFGVTKIDLGQLGDGKTFQSLKAALDVKNGGKKNNVYDALIAEVAIEDEFTLLTTDCDLKDVVEAHGGKILYWRP